MEPILKIVWTCLLILCLTHADENDPYATEYEQLKQKVDIKVTDSPQTMIVKLCHGNPGAMRVLLDWSTASHKKNGDKGILPTLMYMFLLGEYGVIGPKIWMLFKDVCNLKIPCVENIAISLLDGRITEKQLRYAIENRGRGLDVNE